MAIADTCLHAVQRSVVHAALMPTSRFVINEVLGSIAGFEGHILAGPLLDASGQLKVGDWLDIHTRWLLRIQCAGFPLLNWGTTELGLDRGAGLPSDIDVNGLIAETAVSGPDR